MTSLDSDHGGIILESSAVVNDASTIVYEFLLGFGALFSVTGAVFGDIGG